MTGLLNFLEPRTLPPLEPLMGDKQAVIEQYFILDGLVRASYEINP